jgi:hypothetical protein
LLTEEKTEKKKKNEAAAAFATCVRNGLSAT